MRTRHHILAAAGLAGLLSATAIAAPPGGRPGGMPGSVAPIGRPALPPTIGRPATLPTPANANRPNPAGQATNAPDTDRGRSEGKGRTDATTRTIGTVTSFSGTTLTLRLPTGATKTFTVNANAFGQLKPAKGQRVVVSSSANGANAVTVAPANQTITGTVTGVTRTTVTLKLPNGRMETIVVASQAASRMNLAPGVPVTVTSNDGGMSAVRIVPRPRPTGSP